MTATVMSVILLMVCKHSQVSEDKNTAAMLVVLTTDVNETYFIKNTHQHGRDDVTWNRRIYLSFLLLLKGPLWLVANFAENGSLIEYLQSHRPEKYHSYENVVCTDENEKQKHYENVSTSTTTATGIPLLEKLKFAYGIAKGMAHLGKKKVWLWSPIQNN